MDDSSRKIPTMLTLSANLLLSAFLGLAILNGSKPVNKTDAPKAPSADSAAVQNADASIESASNPFVSNQSVSDSDRPASSYRLASSDRTASSYRIASNQTARIEDAKKNGASPEPPGAPPSRRLLNVRSASLTSATSPDPFAHKKRSTSREAAYIPVSELPAPPPAIPVYEPVRTPASSYSYSLSRNQKYGKIKFTGIIGNKAVLSLRRSGTRRKYDTICLAPGEETLTADDTVISVQQVEPDRVTFMLGGKKIVQSLPRVR